ncbi:MAG TPA: hypothetical protein VGQ13_00260 [Nitrososphaera sp.]|nr:hypothetical protein [Nitrososphaera sp.]
MSRSRSHGISSGPLIIAAALVVSLYLQPSNVLSAPDAYAAEAKAEMGQPFSLALNQTASMESADIAVRFVDVTEDSRCPSDVVCIWEGRVSILVDLMQISSGSGIAQFTLSLGGGQVSTGSFGNYSIRLLDVQPYPVSTKEISPSDYVATLVVDSSGGGQVQSHGVLVKAETSNAPVAAVISGWNVEKGKGAAVLFMQGENAGPKRIVVRFVPSSASSCSHGPDPAECIDGQITLTNSNDPLMKEGNKVHLEIDTSKTRLFLTFANSAETGKEYILNITKFKTWLKPIAIDNNTSKVSLKEGQRDGPLLVQKIYSDRIEGLNFPEYPIATDQGYPITLRVGEKASNGCTVMLTLVKIEDNTAVFLKTVDTDRPCPICWLQVALLSG